jgi:hypothetical protein
MNDQSKSMNFLFSKDSFSPHRLINCAKGFINEILSSSSIFKGIMMSFVSCFKNKVDKNSLKEVLLDTVQKSSEEPQPFVQSGWEELILEAGRLEYGAIALHYKGQESWIDNANKELTFYYSNFYSNFRSSKLTNIKTSFNFSTILSQFEDALLKWFDSIVFEDIQKTVSLLKEVEFVITVFHHLSNPKIIVFFPTIIFMEALEQIYVLGKYGRTQGQKVSQKALTIESFTDFLEKGTTNEDKIKWASMNLILGNFLDNLIFNISFLHFF